jgi:plastocyanin
MLRWKDVVVGTLMFIPTIANAATLQIVDQHHRPLANAIVEVLDGSKANPTDVAVMDQVNKSFQPHVLMIKKGQWVSFPNSDDIRHHVYSFSETQPFELKLYHGVPKAPLAFNTAGIVVLGCNIHDSMVGYIYVAESNSVYMSDEKGTVEVPELNAAANYRVWHATQSIGPESVQTLTWNPSEVTKQVVLNTEQPAPRNTFGEKFKGNHAH